MNFARTAAIAACALAAAAAATSADARPRKRHHEASDVIVVRPRSFLDSGTVVPVGSRNFYVQEMTYFNYQPLERTSPGILWRPFPYQR